MEPAPYAGIVPVTDINSDLFPAEIEIKEEDPCDLCPSATMEEPIKIEIIKQEDSSFELPSLAYNVNKASTKIVSGSPIGCKCCKAACESVFCWSEHCDNCRATKEMFVVIKDLSYAGGDYDWSTVNLCLVGADNDTSTVNTGSANLEDELTTINIGSAKLDDKLLTLNLGLVHVDENWSRGQRKESNMIKKPVKSMFKQNHQAELNKFTESVKKRGRPPKTSSLVNRKFKEGSPNSSEQHNILPCAVDSLKIPYKICGRKQSFKLNFRREKRLKKMSNREGTFKLNSNKLNKLPEKLDGKMRVNPKKKRPKLLLKMEKENMKSKLTTIKLNKLSKISSTKDRGRLHKIKLDKLPKTNIKPIVKLPTSKLNRQTKISNKVRNTRQPKKLLNVSKLPKEKEIVKNQKNKSIIFPKRLNEHVEVPRSKLTPLSSKPRPVEQSSPVVSSPDIAKELLKKNKLPEPVKKRGRPKKTGALESTVIADLLEKSSKKNKLNDESTKSFDAPNTVMPNIRGIVLQSSKWNKLSEKPVEQMNAQPQREKRDKLLKTEEANKKSTLTTSNLDKLSKTQHLKDVELHESKPNTLSKVSDRSTNMEHLPKEPLNCLKLSNEKKTVNYQKNKFNKPPKRLVNSVAHIRKESNSLFYSADTGVSLPEKTKNKDLYVSKPKIKSNKKVFLPNKVTQKPLSKNSSPKFPIYIDLTNSAGEHSESSNSKESVNSFRTNEPLDRLDQETNELMQNDWEVSSSSDYSSEVSGLIYSNSDDKRCKYCGVIIPQLEELAIHLTQHYKEKPFSCNVCGAIFKLKTQLTVHTFTHTKETIFTCDICKSGFYAKSHLRCHMLTHTGERPYECPTCGARFNQSSHLKRHVHVHDSNRPKKRKPMAKKYFCEKCDAKFTTVASCKLHMLYTHERLVKYSCSHCSAEFYHKANLNAHLRTHTGERPFCCTVCDASFKQGSHLLRHSWIHSGKKPYPCSFCNMSFRQKFSLKCHTYTHTGEKPYECPVCGKKFRSPGDMSKHKVSHTNQKLFSCMLCDRTFFYKVSLKNHIFTHTGESKRYTCNTCGKSLSNKNSLNHHESSHHPKDDTVEGQS